MNWNSLKAPALGIALLAILTIPAYVMGSRTSTHLDLPLGNDRQLNSAIQRKALAQARAALIDDGRISSAETGVRGISGVGGTGVGVALG